MNPFYGKVAIVTGGASGLGRALCEALASGGARVVVADLNLEGARRVADVIAAAGGEAEAAPLDVTRAGDVRALVEGTAERHGRLDLMFNNAGVAVVGEVRDLELEHWRRVIDVNLLGVVYGTDAAYRVMLRQGAGHIVNTASLAGLVGFPLAVPYAATKHAVVGLSLSLREEAAPLGVRVSAACPGFIRTNIYEAAAVVKFRREGFVSKIPFKMVEADRAARLILRGVARDRAVIILPASARLLWLLARLSLPLLFLTRRKSLRDFRAGREKAEAGREEG